MKALLIANGDAPGAEFLRGLAAEHEMIVAVDGGAAAAMAAGVMPHIVCGDFDSADLDAARAAFPAAEFIPLPDQNLTDLEKAILLMQARGATAITLTSSWGGRIDHALAGVALLLRYHEKIDLRIAGEGFDLYAVSGAFAFAAQAGDTISLIAFGEGARVSIGNVKWVLEDEILEIGTRGISNVALGGEVRLRVSGGAVVVSRLF